MPAFLTCAVANHAKERYCKCGYIISILAIWLAIFSGLEYEVLVSFAFSL